MRKALMLTWEGYQDNEVLYPMYRLHEDDFEVDILAESKGFIYGILGTKVKATFESKNLTNDYVDEYDFLPHLTPYSIMKLGRVKLLPFYMPGDPEMGKAVRGLAGKRSAIMLANHGPVVAGKDIEAACNAIEELEDTARLAMMTRGMNARILNASQVKSIVKKFDVEWDS